MAEVPAPKPAAAIPEKPATGATAPIPSLAREPAKAGEVPWYALALLLGAASAFAEVAVGDLMLTGFLALFFCMVMGALRPGKPWRWVLIVCGCIPLSRLFAAGVLHMYTERAQIYEAFLSFITGNAGAYVGSLGRKRANDLFEMIRTGKR
ncbi:MAG TPA: hypothetical protein VJP04_07755 [Terriglobales bacterium]|nr:hypothetical protein [Terriglobales bacterium]